MEEWLRELTEWLSDMPYWHFLLFYDRSVDVEDCTLKMKFKRILSVFHLTTQRHRRRSILEDFPELECFIYLFISAPAATGTAISERVIRSIPFALLLLACDIDGDS